MSATMVIAGVEQADLDAAIAAANAALAAHAAGDATDAELAAAVATLNTAIAAMTDPAELAAAVGAVTALLAATGKGFVYTTDPDEPRPTGFASVQWVCPEEPTNATDEDTWLDLDASTVATLIAAHDASGSAHADIRAAITAAVAAHAAGDATDAELAAGIAAEVTNRDAAIATHDASGSAHSDIRSAIAAMTDPTELADAISAAIASHAASDATDAELTAAIAAEVANRDAALATKQPLDADLTAIAALTTAPFGRSLLEGAGAIGIRSALGVKIAGEVGGPPVIVRKTADETVNASTALQNDDHLVVAVAANAVYRIELMLLTSAGSTNEDWKFDWTMPAGATLRWGAASGAEAAVAPWGAVASGSAEQAIMTESSVMSIGGANVAGGTLILGILAVAGTAGNLQFRWAQNTSAAVDNKLLTNSLLIADRVA